MEIKSCKNCGRAFGYEGGPVILCNKCDELLWEKVKDYLRDNPNATSEEVSKETKISIKIIESFLADDRLSAIDNETNTTIQFNKCQTCGNIINVGEKYCNECYEKEKKKRLLNEIKSLYQEEESKKIEIKNTGSRMHINTGTGISGKRR